ncbi:STAS domain-containing protein [Actinoplanes sp. CA-030573]|uniref:STAS domain-containing protein n=1 Tax=Actinoplanes sp. CA-030573 TaxID=3239898 RepID=UPI003D91C908
MIDQALTVVTTHVTEAVVVLAPAGDIDRASQSVLEAAATAALDGGGVHLIINLDGVTFCDSSGLSLFIRLQRRAEAGAGSVRLTCPQPMVRTVLQIVNFDQLFEVHPTVDEAVRSARAAA